MNHEFQLKALVELIAEYRAAEVKFDSTRNSRYRDAKISLGKKIDRFIENYQGKTANHENQLKPNTLF